MYVEDTSTSRNNNTVPYDYGDKKAESDKFQILMEILKNFLGGKPTSTVMS